MKGDGKVAKETPEVETFVTTYLNFLHLYHQFAEFS